MNTIMEEAAKALDLAENTDQSKEELRFDNKTFLAPERLEGETFERYKQRQYIQNLFLKERKKGRMWWISTDKVFDKEKDKWFKVGPYTYNKEQYAKALVEYNKHMEEKKLKETQEQTKENTNV